MTLLAHNLQTSAFTTEIDTYLKAHAEMGWFSGAAIVVKADEIVWTQGYGMASLEYKIPNTSSTRFRLASITKQFTAAAILQLQDRGMLNVQMPVSEYLPDYPNGNSITLHHLLTHTAGVPNFTSFPDYQTWMQLPTNLDELIARFQDLPLEFEPGKEFRYSNSGYVLLTKIVETVSGQSYGDYLQEHLFKPLEMENTGYEYPSAIITGLASGYHFSDRGYQKAPYINMLVPQGAGGLYSTVEDLARWNQLLFKPTCREQAILSDEARAVMTSPIVSMAVEEDAKLFYGYGLIIDNQAKHPRIGHNGGINGFVTYLNYYPETDLTIAILSNIQEANLEQMSQDLVAIVSGEAYKLPTFPEKITVDPSVYERYVGLYEVTPEIKISVTIESNQLRLQGVGAQITLYPMSETEYFSQVIDNLRVVFNSNSEGTIESLTLSQNGHETVAPRINSEKNQNRNSVSN